MTTESGPTRASQQGPVGYRYAGQWIRLLALAIDGVLLAVIMIASFVMLTGVLLMADPQATGSAVESFGSNVWPAGLVTYLVTSVVMLAWFAGWQAGAGATPGMFALDAASLPRPPRRWHVRGAPAADARFVSGR